MIWRKCGEAGGIEESNYLDYCNGAKVIHAFKIAETFEFETPIDPFETISDFRPPQSFSYLGESSTTKMLENSQDRIKHKLLSRKRKAGVQIRFP
jgi:hypothetical protein